MYCKQFIWNVKTSNSKKFEIIRFGITGTFATAIQYGFYLLFVAILSFGPEIATILSYGLSFVANFYLSSFFTFKTSPNRKKAVTFAVSHLINLGLQTLLVGIFSRYVPSKYALLPAMAICIPCNFLLVRFALKSKRFQ